MSNTYIAKISFELGIPVGYEFVRYGLPHNEGDPVLDGLGRVVPAIKSMIHENHIILRRSWQPPEYLRESKCKCVRRKDGDWLGCDNYGCALLNITHAGLPFDPPCGPEVPDEQTVRRW